MSIKRRLSKAPNSYREYRADWWAKALASERSITTFDHGRGEWADGSKLDSTEVLLVPRYGHQSDDYWHCGSRDAARIHSRMLLGFPDVQGLTFFNARYIRLSWLPHGPEGTELPGQWQDPRDLIKG